MIRSIGKYRLLRDLTGPRKLMGLFGQVLSKLGFSQPNQNRNSNFKVQTLLESRGPLIWTHTIRG